MNLVGRRHKVKTAAGTCPLCSTSSVQTCNTRTHTSASVWNAPGLTARCLVSVNCVLPARATCSCRLSRRVVAAVSLPAARRPPVPALAEAINASSVARKTRAAAMVVGRGVCFKGTGTMTRCQAQRFKLSKASSAHNFHCQQVRQKLSAWHTQSSPRGLASWNCAQLSRMIESLRDSRLPAPACSLCLARFTALPELPNDAPRAAGVRASRCTLHTDKRRQESAGLAQAAAAAVHVLCHRNIY